MKTGARETKSTEADLVELFVEEMKRRRKRLARLMRLLEREFGPEFSQDPGCFASLRHRCRGKARLTKAPAKA